jgi:hypothetical protein
MGKTEVGKNIPAAFFCPNGLFRSRSHVSSAFLDGAVQLRPGGDG